MERPVVLNHPIPNEAATSAAPLPAKVRVLLADDEDIMRRCVGEALREEPQIELVGEAADGREAVDLIRQNHPDVVVMDINMPGFDGIEATRVIAREFPDIRVIGLSVYDQPEMAIRMRDVGAVEYVRKGTSLTTLIAAILGSKQVH